jgi:hypothetical protein
MEHRPNANTQPRVAHWSAVYGLGRLHTEDNEVAQTYVKTLPSIAVDIGLHRTNRNPYRFRRPVPHPKIIMCTS